MKILALIGTLAAGGSEGQLITLAASMREEGYDFQIAVFRRAGELASLAAEKGIPVHGIAPGRVSDWRRRRRIRGAFVVGALPVAYLLRRERVDLLFTMLYWADVIGAAAARMAPRTVVVSGRRSLQDTRHSPGWFYDKLDELSAARTSWFVANSDAVRKDAISHGVPADRCSVIYNGVRYPPDLERPSMTRALTITAIANLRPVKGLDTLLRAMALVRATLPALSLQIAGTGPELDRLRELARELGVSERVTFLGHVADVSALLTGTDIFVQSSVSEGFSNSLLEAMAEGVAVVATDVGGTREAIGDAGILIGPRDPSQLADAIRLLAGDERLRRRIGETGRQRVRAQFSVDRMTRSYAELFDRLVKG